MECSESEVVKAPKLGIRSLTSVTPMTSVPPLGAPCLSQGWKEEMKTIAAGSVSAETLQKLSDVARDVPELNVRDAIVEMAETVQSGRDVVVAGDSDRVTPALAARILGVSRTHLYKVMDADQLPWIAVGRDRRISLADLRDYIAAQDDVRKAAAERFAHPGVVREAALTKYKAKRR